MDLLQTIIIAIVEGLTEFLPVSSTGHMIIAQNMLGIESTPFVKAFTIIIQFGAILSVVLLYWKRFFHLNACKIMDKELIGDRTGMDKWKVVLKQFLYKYDFYWKLFLAFLPAAFFGLLLSDLIDSLLENIWVVAIMLVVGGVVMLFVDKWFNKKDNQAAVTNKSAFRIGLFQCIAMIPGVSRSMATIVGGMSQGLTRKAAAEFSFFLAVPTMFAAMSYKMLKLFLEPDGINLILDNLMILLVGNVVAFVVALLAIKFFIAYVTKYGFKAFGYYRIIVGGAIIILLMLGHNLEVV